MNHPLSLFILLCSLFAPATATLADESVFNGGHIKYLFFLNRFADNSLFADAVKSPAIDHNGDLRLKFDWHSDKLQFKTDYQLIVQHGDSLSLAGKLPANAFIPSRVPNDDSRLLKLTKVISEDNNNTLITHRLDRFYLTMNGEKSVLKIGRQAVSWGNGLIYTPMDFFNPFSPSAVDKEYKTGDDMLYGQYLKHNGDDLQAVWVVRRNEHGKVDREVNSIALKYHGFKADNEYDLMIARHYGDNIIGLGGNMNTGGAIWRGDLTFTKTGSDTITSLVTSLSYSWTQWGDNISGILEYFYNGFGQTHADYSPAALANNPALVERLQRGELFTPGRQYLAASATIEITPLWQLTPNVFINISDQSLLTQIVSTYSLQQNWQLLTAFALPVGAPGTEYGGIDSGIKGKPLSTEFNLFAELAWYF